MKIYEKKSWGHARLEFLRRAAITHQSSKSAQIFGPKMALFFLKVNDYQLIMKAPSKHPCLKITLSFVELELEPGLKIQEIDFAKPLIL